jgi:hypothetical protein
MCKLLDYVWAASRKIYYSIVVGDQENLVNEEAIAHAGPQSQRQ